MSRLEPNKQVKAQSFCHGLLCISVKCRNLRVCEAFDVATESLFKGNGWRKTAFRIHNTIQGLLVTLNKITTTKKASYKGQQMQPNYLLTQYFKAKLKYTKRAQISDHVKTVNTVHSTVAAIYSDVVCSGDT